MSSIDEEFTMSVELVPGLKKRPEDAELLKLYGLYKQATIGNCNTSAPTFCLNYIKDNAKWNSWNKYKGMKIEKAKEAYTNFVLELVEKYGLKK
jgi:diazepam-binding inhibitor (GABA receptor modulating acyl-CoA-binding protein)